MEDREIDFKECIWKVIFAWKAMIVCGIMFAVLLTGGMYLKDSMTYEQKKSDLENIHDMDYEFTDDEQSSVDTMLNYLAKLDELRTYRAEAPILAIDPYDATRLSLQYSINLIGNEMDGLYIDDDGQIMGNSAIAKIVSVYYTYMQSDEFLGKLIEALSLDMDNDELRELTRISTDVGIVTIDIYMYEGMAQDKLSEVVSALLTERKSVYGNIAEFDIELINEQLQQGKIEVLVDKKSNVDAQIVNLENQITALKGKLSTSQLEYVENVHPTIELKEPVVSIKFIIIGFIVGVFLVCFVVFVKVVMSSKLALADDLEAVFGLNLIGVISATDSKKKFLHCVDNLLLKIKNRRKKTYSNDKRIEFAVTSLVIKCEQANTKKICISSTELDKLDEEVISELKSKLTDNGITIELIDDIYYDGKALKQCVECGHVLFIEKVGTSIYDEIYNQVNKAKEYDLNVLGAIAIY